MGFVLEQLQQLGMVAIIMVCAIGGTVGILKLIKPFAPGKHLPDEAAAQRQDGNNKRLDEEDGQC